MTRHLAMAIVLLLLGSTRLLAQTISPGPLAKDHASLEGVDGCVRCHSSGDAISPAKCFDCHKALEQRINAKAGYHAKAVGTCASCHPDHRGVAAALVRWPGGKPSAFDHAKLADFPLRDAHAALECRKCHTPAKFSSPVAKVLSADERPRTYLGLGKTCGSCHADPHKPSLGADCASCHNEKKWHDATSTFDHGKTKYPLKGAHAKVDCVKCHGGTTAKLADLHPAFATCATCHKDPHAGTMSGPMNCTRCHQETAWKDLRFNLASHAPKTFPLAGGHKPPPCSDCHGPKLDKPVVTACSACHTDAHKPSLGSDCASCHNTTAWAGGKPKGEFHDRTAFPLRGLHTGVACAKCHDPKKPASRRFRPLPHAKCMNCHTDPHLGETKGACEDCHDVQGWKPARFEATDHARTAFALEGAHQAVPCASCHPGPPKSPGFARGNPACETCHKDPHAGQFAPRTCASCHEVSAWSPSRFAKVEHAKTGFGLDGKHDVACARCHAGTPARFKDTPKECSACHADVHRGQFAPRACTTCHAGASFTPAVGFNHAKTFVLRGKHAQAKCVDCHPKLSLAGQATAIYHLTADARSCVGCHKPQHGDPQSPRAVPRALAAATTDCATCHVETGWGAFTRPRSFDHAVTGSPLEAGHARVPCGSCHRPQEREVGKMASCDSCHTDRHRGQLGNRCERCHSARTWKPDATLVDHQRTRLPLLGAHAVQGCPTCHPRAAEADFRGQSPACASCHLHTVVERNPHPSHDGPAFASCEECHSSMGWRPAHFNHDRFWPLTGAHTSTACGKCHKTTDFAATPTACVACHQQDLDAAPFNHAGLDTSHCEQCHTTVAWKPATLPNHTPFFPLTAPHNLACGTCHTTPGMFQAYSCIDCHTHSRAQTDDHHQEVSGYSYVSSECYRCHKDGRVHD